MGKSAPSAPDPVATANAQAAANSKAAVKQVELNNADSYSPLGSVKYTQMGTYSDGTPHFVQTTAYSPTQQQTFDNTQNLLHGEQNIALNELPRLASSLSTSPYQMSNNLPNLQTSIGAPSQHVRDANSLPSTGTQSQLNTSGVTALANPNDYAQQVKQAQDAVYGSYKNNLDPQYAQAEKQQRDMLAQNGFSTDSAGYQQAMSDFDRNKASAYQQANNAAVTQGNELQNQLYGQNLAANAQTFGQANTSGQFANTAQSQNYGEALSQLNAALGINNQQFNQNQAQGVFSNQALQTGQSANSYLQNLPINQISSLNAGGQVSAPQAAQFSGANIAAPDIGGYIMQNYQNQLGSNNANNQGLFGLGGAALNAAATYYAPGAGALLHAAK